MAYITIAKCSNGGKGKEFRLINQNAKPVNSIMSSELGARSSELGTFLQPIRTEVRQVRCKLRSTVVPQREASVFKPNVPLGI